MHQLYCTVYTSTYKAQRPWAFPDVGFLVLKPGQPRAHQDPGHPSSVYHLPQSWMLPLVCPTPCLLSKSSSSVSACTSLLQPPGSGLFGVSRALWGFPGGTERKVKVLVTQSCPDSFATPRTVACQAPLSMEFPGKNTGVGCHFLLRGSSWIRDQTHVSCNGTQILYLWATGEACLLWEGNL